MIKTALNITQVPSATYYLLQILSTVTNRKARLQKIERYIGSNIHKPQFPHKVSRRMNIYEHGILLTLMATWCKPFFKSLGLDANFIIRMAAIHDDHEGAPFMTDYCATEKQRMSTTDRIKFEIKDIEAIQWAIEIYGPHFDAVYGAGSYKKHIFAYKNRETKEAKWIWFLDKFIQQWEGLHEVFLGNPYFAEVISNGKQKTIEYAIQEHWKHSLTKPNTPKILQIFNYDSAVCDMTACKDKKFFHKNLITGYPVYDGFTEMLFHYYKPNYVYGLLLPVEETVVLAQN